MIAQELIELTRRFSKKMGGLRFGGAVANVYNPLDYARIPHEEYLRRYAAGEIEREEYLQKLADL